MKIFRVLMLLHITTIFINSALAQTTQYTYDALGRLTFVEDVNGNRDYDYDSAGNRIEMIVNSNTDEPPILPPLPAPTLPAGACWLIGPGAWKASWNTVPGAVAYQYRTEVGNEYIVTALESVQTSPCKWVRACTGTTAASCNGVRAYF